MMDTPRLKFDVALEIAKEQELDPEMTVQQLRALYFSNQMIQNLREKYLRQDLIHTAIGSYEQRQKKLVQELAHKFA